MLGGINSDLFIYTTINSGLQERIAAIAKEKVAEAKDKKIGQAAAVAIEKTGEIRAMVGGTDYQSSQFNRALAMRQPGSAFKPVVYLVALENGCSPSTMVNDSPFAIGDYTPKNYNERYYGDISLATAFAKSVNSVPLRLAQEYGIGAVLKMAGRLGVGAKLRREYSTVLGASEMTLLDLTAMYAVVWNDGNSVRPFGIEKITTPAGKILYSRDPSESVQLLSPSAAASMQELMSDVLKAGGTGRRAAGETVLGGKTGTSNDNRDAWFVGAEALENSILTIGVWVGNDDFSPMDKSITGGTIPAEIFGEIAAE
jgi:penicillin-binding protein 1A